MRVRRVTAHAFGPLRGETLELADGLTVIYGGNESAKSSWHAAIYAALCGRRRGAGAPARDRRFAERHKPWDHGEWLVTAEVHLDDGRRVELRQDLERGIDSHAKDLDLATDYSAEIMNDGTPDATRWLGLDRGSFAATALIAQSRMLEVLDEAGGLQSYLQRAAATAGDEATAAGALRRIEAFRREQIGQERLNSSRPLQRAVIALRQARAELDLARTGLAEYERRQIEVERLRGEEAEALRILRLHEAAQLYARAAVARTRAAEAASIAERLDGPAPNGRREPEAATQGPGADLETVQRVAAAVAGLRTARAAADAYDVQAHQEAVPEPAGGPGAAVATARLGQARAHRARRRAAWLLAGGVVAGTLGGAVGVAGDPRIALWAAVLGAVLATVGLALVVRSGLPAARRALLAAEAAEGARLEADRMARARVARQRDLAAAAAARLARDLGLDPVSADEALDGLTEWQDRFATTAARAELDRRDRDRLAHLLGGASVESLRTEARMAQERADRLGFTADDVHRITEHDQDRLASLGEAARAMTEQAAAAAGALATWGQTLRDVAEAEERVARAEAHEARLRRLDQILDRTQQFLTAAQERAHRDIAPVLADSVRRRLPDVTAGRYLDVIVDPADLHVEVCGPGRRWRRAELLSHGTAEQIYLLLRIALAEHLARPGEVCPLILDDVIVNADGERAARLLSLLHSTAEDRQIVLFTHQARVRDWAGEHLGTPEHGLRELATVAP